MNAYTRQDLSVMQAWPLERKIRVTQAKIIEWYHHYGGKVAVSFSGGKDSTVLLDLARRAFPRSYRNTAIPSYPRMWRGASATPERAAHGRSAT